MSFLKNRTVLGAVCIAVSLVICFAVTPLFNKSVSHKTNIVRVTENIKTGDLITKDMIKTVDVGGFNLPDNVLKDIDSVIGKYATADMHAGDYILPAKLSESPAAENRYLYNLNGEKQAISVTVKTFAAGLSGKLQSGDVVSVIAPDYRKQGLTVIPVELRYMEVIAVTTSTGRDANTGEHDENKEKNLPTTVTLLALPEQSKILAALEADGRPHMALVYRGRPETAAKFIAAQDEAIAALYEQENDESSETAAISERDGM